MLILGGIAGTKGGPRLAAATRPVARRESAPRSSLGDASSSRSPTSWSFSPCRSKARHVCSRPRWLMPGDGGRCGCSVGAVAPAEADAAPPAVCSPPVPSCR